MLKIKIATLKKLTITYIQSIIQFIIEDEAQLKVSKFECEYRAVQRDEITNLLKKQGMQVWWKFPDDTGFYQPIVIAKK